MEKKVIRINEADLRNIVKESVEQALNDADIMPTQNGGRNILNEMARLNKKDGSNSPFPSNKYKIWVQGDNSPHKPAHMHISYPQEEWQIKVYIESGQLWQIVNPGKRGANDSFSDVIRQVQKWFKLPTTMPGRVGTNQDAALNEWEACNDE